MNKYVHLEVATGILTQHLCPHAPETEILPQIDRQMDRQAVSTAAQQGTLQLESATQQLGYLRSCSVNFYWT